MAAYDTLPHSFTIPQISKLGVLTLYGYGIRVTMQAGHLYIEDGIGPERRKLRLPRVGHRLKRLVCIGEDGFVTLSALRWLTETGASFRDARFVTAGACHCELAAHSYRKRIR